MVVSPNLNALFLPTSSIWDILKQEYTTDPYLQRLGQLASNKPGEPYKWQNGIILFKGRVVLSPNSPLIAQLLHEYHDSNYGGNSGVLRTYKKVHQQFYRPSMQQTVQRYVGACSICLKNKSDSLSPAGLLQPLPIPCNIWDDITMDFIDGLPPSNGKTTIFVVVDRLSKSAHFMAMAHPYGQTSSRTVC